MLDVKEKRSKELHGSLEHELPAQNKPGEPLSGENIADEKIDVIIVGGGIAGLGAALRIRNKGYRPLVLEAEARVGGRMTTDRLNGYKIDRGVTLLGNHFNHMKEIVCQIGLACKVRDRDFTLGLADGENRRSYRARKPFDVFSNPDLSFAARFAFLRLTLALLRHKRALEHGRSDRSTRLDTQTLEQYMASFGQGGRELFEQIIQPAIRGAIGGSPTTISAAVALQAMWNTMIAGFWGFPDQGLDIIPERMAARVPVLTHTRVISIRYDRDGVGVEVEIEGSRKTLKARGVIIAVPGHLVPALCPQLPVWLSEPLRHTRYAPMVSAHIALPARTNIPYLGYGFATGPKSGTGVFEIEHVRSPGCCPDGQGMISVYLPETEGFPSLSYDDPYIRKHAVALMKKAFPEIAEMTPLFIHIIRWEVALPLFPPGRLTEMVNIRKRLAFWEEPLDLCGDYLDGISSEGALCTGEQAAERLLRKLRRSVKNS